MNLMPRLNQTWHQLLSNRPRRSCDKHSHHQLLHRGLPYTPQDKTAAPAVTPPSTPARKRRRGGGNAGDRLATLVRRASPTTHREDHSRSASGTMASASPHRGGETPLDRPRAHCPGAAAVKNRVGDLLAYTPSYELLVVC